MSIPRALRKLRAQKIDEVDIKVFVEDLLDDSLVEDEIYNGLKNTAESLCDCDITTSSYVSKRFKNQFITLIASAASKNNEFKTLINSILIALLEEEEESLAIERDIEGE